MANKIKVVTVRALVDGFRRAGYAFNRAARHIAVSELSKEQIKQLNEEPNLAVIEQEVDAADVAGAQETAARDGADEKSTPANKTSK